jgi:hypothetical protein
LEQLGRIVKCAQVRVCLRKRFDRRRGDAEDARTIGGHTSTVGHGVNRKARNGSMRKTTVLAIGITALAVWLGTSLFGTAQEKASSHRCEVAIVKWDGNDKVCVNLPGKAEILHVYDLSGNRTPKEMQEEEFCLTWMANKMAKDGWEVVTLDSRRLVFRRPLSQ